MGWLKRLFGKRIRDKKPYNELDAMIEEKRDKLGSLLSEIARAEKTAAEGGQAGADRFLRYRDSAYRRVQQLQGELENLKARKGKGS